MDPSSAAALVAAAAAAAGSSAAGEAGRQAWESLVGLVRRAAGRPDGTGEQRPEGPADPADLADPGDEEQVRLLCERVVERMRADDAFAEVLLRWSREYREVLGPSGDPADRRGAANVVSGTARVCGSVLQVGGDVQGDIHLG